MKYSVTTTTLLLVMSINPSLTLLLLRRSLPMARSLVRKVFGLGLTRHSLRFLHRFLLLTLLSMSSLATFGFE